MDYFKKIERSVTISADKRSTIDLHVDVWSQDLNVTKFILKLDTTDSTVIDLTNATVRVAMVYIQDGKNVKIETAGIVEDVATQKIAYIMDNKLAGFEGKVIAGFYVTLSTGQRIDIQNVTFNMRKSLLDKDLEVAKDSYYKTFDDIVADVQATGNTAKTQINQVLPSVQAEGEKVKTGINAVVSDVNLQKQTINDVVLDVQSVGDTQKESINNVLTDVQSTADTVKADINAVLPTVNSYADTQKQAINDIVADVQSTGDTAKADIKATLPTLQGQISELSESVVEISEEIGNIEEELEYLVEKKGGTNRLDLDSFTVGMQVSSSGYFFENDSYALSNPIYVEGASKLRYMLVTGYNGTASRAFFYKDNPFGKTTNEQTALAILPLTNVIESPWDGRQGKQYELIVPADAKYFVFLISKTHYEAMKTYADRDGIYSQAQADIDVISEFYPYEHSEVIVKSSNEVITARGNFDTLKDRLDDVDVRLVTNTNTVLYFGDSLTQGNQDGTKVTRQSILSTLLGGQWNVENYGVGGEKSHTISARASGSWFYLDAGITIPSDGSAIDVTTKIHDEYGTQQNFGNGIYSSAYDGWITVNPCYVNGVECTLQKANASAPVTIKRNTVGDAINITRPTRIHFNSETFEKNPVLILCLGQNEGFNRDADILISQIKGIIEFYESSRYIVVGIPHALYGYTWEAQINEALKKEFGKHYLDIERYMKTPIYDADGETIISSYALSDAGLTPTEDDLSAISANKYPPQIMYDGIHFNHYGYRVWANQEYLLGKDLGYW